MVDVQHNTLDDDDLHPAGRRGINTNVVPELDGVHIGHDGTNYHVTHYPGATAWSRIAMTSDLTSSLSTIEDALDVETAELDAHIGSGGVAAHAEATTSVAGFIPAADKTFIDAHKSAATELAQHPAMTEYMESLVYESSTFGSGFWMGRVYGEAATTRAAILNTAYQYQRDIVSVGLGNALGSLSTSFIMQRSTAPFIIEAELSISTYPDTAYAYIIIPVISLNGALRLEVHETTTDVAVSPEITTTWFNSANDERTPSWSSSNVQTSLTSGLAGRAFRFPLVSPSLASHRYRVTLILGTNGKSASNLMANLGEWLFAEDDLGVTRTIPFSDATYRNAVLVAPSEAWES